LSVQLDDFEKVRVLGVGGTGIVYELLHNTNGTRFAMKEMEIKTSYQMQVTARCLCCAAFCFTIFRLCRNQSAAQLLFWIACCCTSCSASVYSQCTRSRCQTPPLFLTVPACA
jgi:serine/threonine protein kinase